MQSITKKGWLLAFKQLSTYIAQKRSKLLSTWDKQLAHRDKLEGYFKNILYVKILVWLQAIQPMLHTTARSMVLVLRLSSLNFNSLSAISNSLSSLVHLCLFQNGSPPFQLCPTSLPCQGGISQQSASFKNRLAPIGTISLSKHSSHMSQ